MKFDRNKVVTTFALTLLIISLLSFFNVTRIVTGQESEIYLHGPPLEPIHMHGPPLVTIHMHSKIGMINLSEPMWTPWHELYPDYCQNWTFTSWEDNGNGFLDSSDQIDMTNDDTEEIRWYHVDRVTMTMRLYSEFYDETIYVEYKGPYEPYIQPVCTNWSEVWPVYLGVTGGPYHVCVWDDTGIGNEGYLGVCDSVGFDQFPEVWWHVEEYSTDLILNEKIMDPRGIWWHELYPSFCNSHYLQGWEEPMEDPYPGRLSPRDQIYMFNETSGITEWYFVDRVTLTLFITINATGEPYYFEFKGAFEEMYEVKTQPVCTYWHMVWPDYLIEPGPGFHLTEWIDNCNGVLDYCDYIYLEGVWCHVEEVSIDIILNKKIADPTCTVWHELYPRCCANDYHIQDWTDNGDILLSPCDNVTMQLLPDGPTETYHVENVTLTLNLTVLDADIGPFAPGDRIYVELVWPYEWMHYYNAKIYPWDTNWTVVCHISGGIPNPDWFGYPLTITYWQDTCNGILSFCDTIGLTGPEQDYTTCHVDEVAVDIIVKEVTVEPVHDVAVTNVSPYFASVYQGWPCPIQVTVENQGDYTETFDVDVKYDGNHVTTSPITVNSLPPHTSKNLTFCWVTKNVPLGPYNISAYAHQVPGETDLVDNTLVDGTVTIQAPFPSGFYWKEGFCDYAPSGMPDFDERQDAWNATGTWTWCSPTAVANSLWWFDSEYEPTQPPVLPPTMVDGFPLVTSYNPGVWDDHDPQNVQPFIQHLAYLMDTDGQRTGIAHRGTYVNDMQTGITHYLSWSGVNPLGDVNGDGIVNQTDVNIVNATMGTMPGMGGWDMRADVFPITLGWPGAADNIIDLNDLALVTGNINATGMFYEHTVRAPDFYYIEEEVEKSQDVVLSIGFWYWNGEFWEFREELGHSVTVAGVNSRDLKVAISDPMWNAFEDGWTMEGRVPIPHMHMPPEPPYTTHNDAALVSHDIYDVVMTGVPGPGSWILHFYPGVPTGEPIPWPMPGWYAVVEDAVITSPLGVHDVAVTNLTTSKDGCTPMPTVSNSSFVEMNVTVLNEGDFVETFAVTAYANATMIGTATVTNLAPLAHTIVNFTWYTSGWSKGNYTISAYATPVPSEMDIADNTFTNGIIKVVIPGDINGDGTVDVFDAVLLSGAAGSQPGSSNWNPNADLNGDLIIDVFDAVILSGHAGETDP